MTDTHHLSRRGRALIDAPPLPEYIREHFARVPDAYDPDTGEGSYIPLCIAENRLVWDLLRPKLQAARAVPHSALCYDAMVGSLEFREKLAAFLGEAFLGRRFAPEQLAVLSGAGSVLELLFYGLCDAGDAVLVPTPSYAGFWADLETRDELHIVPVPTESANGFRLTVEQLDRALATAGKPVRALLFTTPDNPLGRVYTKGELGAVLAWAEQNELHVVFDEIYALSVFGETPFTSVCSLRPELGPRTHIVWAFSKDFGASGLRCGILISENEELLAAVDGLAYWAACSGDTQFLLGEMIADTEWVTSYAKHMRKRLADAYAAVTRALDRARIPYLPAQGGFFLLLDLRRFLDENTWAGEERLWRRILEEAGVNLTPGSACRIGEPGFLRLCYAGVPSEAATLGIERAARALAPR